MVLKLWRRHKNCLERHTHKKKKKTIYPIAGILGMGYNQSYDSCVLHVVLWLKVCMKFHEMCQAVSKLWSRYKNC